MLRTKFKRDRMEDKMKKDTRKKRTGKKGSNILKRMLEIKNKAGRQKLYGCHTVSPYGDGYGDTGYGDYEDAV